MTYPTIAQPEIARDSIAGEPTFATFDTLPPVGQPLAWLGGPIDVRVEVGTGIGDQGFGQWGVSLWGEGRWAGIEPQWQDLSPYVLGVSFRRGRERWGDRFEAGTLTVTVDNTDGFLTPDVDVPSPLEMRWRPGIPIRVVAIPHAGLVVPLWRGYVDSSADGYEDGAHDVVATVAATDAMALFQRNNPPALETPFGVARSHVRVRQALDRANWPVVWRLIQMGEHRVQADTLADSTLEECAKAAEAEGGAFYVDAQGYAVFRSRDWLTTDQRSVVIQGYIGLPAEATPVTAATGRMIAADTSWELARVTNDVQFSRVGGTVYRAVDIESRDRYGGTWRTHQQLDLTNQDDSAVEFLADRWLAAFQDDRFRLDSVTIAANQDPDDQDLNRLLWRTEIGDLLRVRVQTGKGWAYTKLVHVAAIEHEITADDWRATFRLDDSLTFVPEPEEA